MKSKAPHLVFLIETKCNSDKMERIRIKLGFDYCFSVNCKGRSGGLALLWNSTMGLEIFNYTSFHIPGFVKLSTEETTWFLTRFYGHPNTAKRIATWDLLKALTPAMNVSWLCFRDFNDITSLDEKLGVANRPYRQILHFRAL